jgi:hypothetical protein
MTPAALDKALIRGDEQLIAVDVPFMGIAARLSPLNATLNRLLYPFPPITCSAI